MIHFKKAALSLAVVSSIALVGCSGSSSSGGGSVDIEPASQTVSGAAVKGVLKNARVTVYELDDSGDRLRTVGTVTTDDHGEYEVSLSSDYEDGLLEIEVTAIPGETRMVCDASACGTVKEGEDLDLPGNFKLSALANKPSSGDKISAPVTAWSTMATSRAKARAVAGGNISEASKEANFKVQQLVGFDPSRVAAKDVRKLDGASSDEQQAAVMNAVVAELMFSDSEGSTSSDDYVAKLEKFTRSIENDDSFGDGDDGFTVSDIAVATEKTLENVQIPDPNAVSNIQKRQTVFADPDNAEGVQTPEYDPDAVVDEGATQEQKIASFKQFVSEVRSWATSIEDIDSAQLGEVVDLETIQAVFQDGPLASLKLSQEVVNQSLEAVALSPADIPGLLDTGETRSIDIVDNGVVVGTADLTVTDNEGLQVQAVGNIVGETQTRFLPFNLTIRTNLPVSAFDYTPDAEKLIRLLANSEVSVSGQVEDGSGGTLGRLNNVVAKLELAKELVADPATGSVTDAQVNEAFAGASLNGNVELFAGTGESFNGTIEARLTRLLNNQFVLNDTPVSVRKLGVRGTFTAADGETFDASATLNVNNASDFDTFAWVDYSKADRWYYGQIDTGDLGAQLGESFTSAVEPELSLWVDGDQQGSLNIQGYYPTGNLQHFSPQLDLVEGQALAAAVIQAVYANIPSLEMSVQNSATGEVRTEIVNLQSALAGNIVRVAWDQSALIWDDVGAPSLGVIVSGVDIGLESGETASLGNVTTAEGLTISASYVDGEFSLQLEGMPIAPPVEQALAEGYALTDAAWSGFLYEEAWSQGGFLLPATSAIYEQCLVAPAEFLSKIGRSDSLSEWTTESRACAQATLEYSWVEEPLDESLIPAISGVVRQAFATELMGLEDDVELVDYYIGTDYEGNGYVSATVKFPDLEDDTHFIDASLSLSAKARNIPDMPEAKVVATANRNSRLGAQVFATLQWDEGQYEIEMSSDNLDSPSEITGRFYNAYGKELDLTLSLSAEGEITDLTGDAFINGEDVGDVSLRNGIPVLTYPNGDTTEFESLF